MSRIGDTANRLAYYAYRGGVQVGQLPQVWREREPRFASDETVAPAVGDRFAIVVKFALIGVTEDFLDLLAALRRHRVNAIVVCNGPLVPAEMEALRRAAHRILVRRNIGRDFGAYRAATLRLHAEGLRPARMLYLNDSVIYLRGEGLDALVRALADDASDVTGAFENHEFIHHFGTYAFGVSAAAFGDPEVLRFWRQYRPYDLRPHAIRRGEVALAECLKEQGYRLDVVYSADRLALRLDAMTLPELVALLRYVPYGALRSYELRELLAGARQTGRMLRSRGPAPPSARASRTPSLSEYRAAAMAARQDSEQAQHGVALAERIERDVLVNHIMGTIIHGSQAHFGFGLFHRVMGSPLVKRDLLLRGVLMEHDCVRILDHLPAERRDPILRELLNRGRAVNVRGLRRFKLRNGLI